MLCMTVVPCIEFLKRVHSPCSSLIAALTSIFTSTELLKGRILFIQWQSIVTEVLHLLQQNPGSALLGKYFVAVKVMVVMDCKAACRCFHH